MPQRVEETKEEKEKNDIDFLETAIEFYSEGLNTARNIENWNQKKYLRLQRMLMKVWELTKDWVIKDEDDVRNISSNVKEHANKIIEDAITYLSQRHPLPISQDIP